METSTILTIVFYCITETVMLHHAFMTFLDRNEVKKKYYCLALLFYMLCTLLTSGDSFSIYFVSLFCYSLIVLFALIFFENPLEVKLIVSFMFVALNYAYTVLAATFLWQIRGNPVPDYPLNLAPTFWSQIILYVLFTLSVFVIDKLRSFKQESRLLFNGIYVFGVPLCMLLLILKLFYMTMLVDSHDFMLENFFIISGLLLLTALSLYFLSDRTNSMNETLKQKEIVEQLMAMQASYYREIESQQKEIRSLSHDMKSHLRFLNTLLAKEQYQKAGEYIRTIDADAQSVHSISHSGNPVFDAILSTKLMRAKELGVKLELDIIIPPAFSINDVDICILLGNLVDNAMEACQRIDKDDRDRFIYLNARVQKGFLCIQINNSYNGDLNVVNDAYATVKTEKRFCGIGLSNIKRIVEKNCGKLNITHTDTVFSVLVLLSLEETSD